MTTDWKWRVMLFIRAVDNTAQNRQAFAQIFVDGNSGETLENESKLFDSVVRLSATGQEPVQAFGVNTAAKASMRDGFKNLLDGLTNARYVITANAELPSFSDGELILHNFPNAPEPNGQIITWNQVLNFIENEFGFVVIEPQI